MRKAEVTKKYELTAHYESMLEVFIESLNPMIYLCEGTHPDSDKPVEAPSYPWLLKYK
jgi:hypothetical protein